jgi:isopentenyl phosphate kinase
LGNQITPIILKLGGSVISIKGELSTPNNEAISRLAGEIAASNVDSSIIVHGGGSFGHPTAYAHKIKDGYKDPSQLIGFSKTHQAMTILNNLVINALIMKNLPAVTVQPSSYIITENGRINNPNFASVEKMLNLGLTPVLHGDVVFDSKLVFTILSGDQLVSVLSNYFHVKKIILGVDVDGLYTSDPRIDSTAKLLNEVTLDELKKLLSKIGASDFIDVTGGMYGKMFEMIPAIENGAEVIVVNAGVPGRVFRALRNMEVLGTVMRGA